MNNQKEYYKMVNADTNIPQECIHKTVWEVIEKTDSGQTEKCKYCGEVRYIVLPGGSE